MKEYDREIILEIYDILLNNKYKHNLLNSLIGNPHDIVRKYFILDHIEFIKYNADIYEDECLFNWYKNYFQHSYIYTNQSINFKTSLILLIRHYKKSYVLKLHNKFIDHLKDEIFKHSSYTREHYIYLVELYDNQFNKRLTEEITNLQFNYLLIKDSLNEDEKDGIKQEYEYLDSDVE